MLSNLPIFIQTGDLTVRLQLLLSPRQDGSTGFWWQSWQASTACRLSVAYWSHTMAARACTLQASCHSRWWISPSSWGNHQEKRKHVLIFLSHVRSRPTCIWSAAANSHFSSVPFFHLLHLKKKVSTRSRFDSPRGQTCTTCSSSSVGGSGILRRTQYKRSTLCWESHLLWSMISSLTSLFSVMFSLLTLFNVITIHISLSLFYSYVTVSRSFYSTIFGRRDIGDGLECWRGYYQSLRPTQMGLSLNIGAY